MRNGSIGARDATCLNASRLEMGLDVRNGAGRKADGNSSHHQEERNSRVAVIGKGRDRSKLGSLLRVKGLDVTAPGKKEAHPAMVQAGQRKA